MSSQKCRAKEKIINNNKSAPEKEKQALEKATGQNPQPESEKDPKPDNQQADNQPSVAEIFELSDEKF